MLLVAWLEWKSAKSFRTELSILSQKVENKEEEYNVENEENRVENKEDEEEVENEDQLPLLWVSPCESHSVTHFCFGKRQLPG